MLRRCAGVGALLLVGVAIPASANAAVIFGHDLDPDFPPLPAQNEVFCNPQDLTVTCTDIAFKFHDGNAFSTTAPVSGVVTSVRYRSNTADQATLRLARVDPQTEEAVGVGVGPTATLNATGEITEVPVNPGLPIQQGDYLAGEGNGTTAWNCADLGGTIHIFLPPLEEGAAPRMWDNRQLECEVLIQGTIEPDADGDRLGDESQDSDDDNDSVADAFDNCPLVANTSQSNVDGDALGDACDLIDNRPAPPGPTPETPTPELGRLFVARTVSGTVTIAFPGGFVPTGGARAAQKGLTFIPLEQAREIPVGSFLNTRRGTVNLTAAVFEMSDDPGGRARSGPGRVRR